MTEAAVDSPHLEAHQQQQAAAAAPLQGLVIHEVIRAEGEHELSRGIPEMAWSGLAAGLSMGFSYLTQALLRSGLPDQPWRHLVASLGYIVGFAIVVLGRQQLFTESTLSAVLPVLTNKNRPTLVSMLRLWAVVLAANLVGTWLFAAALAAWDVFRPEVVQSLGEIAGEAVQGPFWPTLLKAVFAGWLIALMVWLLPSARTARLLVIALITYVVALARLSHIIAGSSEAAYAVLTARAGFTAYVMDFLLPTLIGNTIGGVALVAMLNHAPIAPKLAEAAERAAG
jgi:formate/nitrite transporter FocA (FNT family)